MDATVRSLPLDRTPAPGRSDASLIDVEGTAPPQRSPGGTSNRRAIVAGFMDWLVTHRPAVTMAGLLSFAAPVTFFTGAVSVMREPGAGDVTRLGLWWLLYGVELWGLLLATGYASQRLAPAAARSVRGAIWLLGAAAAALSVNLSTAGRAGILIEQGVVTSVLTMHLYAFSLSFTMALLYFAHLRRSHRHEVAVSRLALAQAAQRQARQRIVQARLQAVHARIDPQLLFEMLDAVRRSYLVDAPSAEHLLDELIDFLRAALPRLRMASSSVAREAELARAYVQLRKLAGASDAGLTIDGSAPARHARFPPGVLLPLLDDALRQRTGACKLSASCAADRCRLVLTLPARPADATVAGVRSLLADVYAASACLSIEGESGAVAATIELPYELA